MQDEVVDKKASDHYYQRGLGSGGDLILFSLLLLFLPQHCSQLARLSSLGLLSVSRRRSLIGRISSLASVAGVVRQFPSIFLGSGNKTLWGGAGATTNWHTPKPQSTPCAQNRGSILILLRHHFRNQPTHGHVINVMLLCARVGLELMNFCIKNFRIFCIEIYPRQI